jgi:ABC-type multidrug transport system ATPase subunit
MTQCHFGVYTMPILIANDITIHRQNKWIVNHYNCEVRTGEIHAIVGPSQSGKSSTLLALAGFIKPDSGSIYIETREKKKIHAETDGPDSPDVSRERPGQNLVSLGPIPVYAPLFETLTVREQLYFQAKILKQRKAKQRADELIEFYGLKELANKRCKDLNRFSYFIIALAFSRIRKTPFLLLDEPDGGLTDEEWSSAASYLADIAAEGVGIVFTTNMQTSADVAEACLKASSKEVKEFVHS